MEAKKSSHRVERTSVWLISYYEESFATKLYRKDFPDVDHMKRVLLQCEVQ